MEKILILYSNPIDTERIRLDKEHRSLDDILEQANVSKDTVVRLHATRLQDLLNSLSAAEYEIVQFSSHGSSLGFYLESENDSEKSVLISSKQIAELLKKTQPNLKSAIFLSCFSADSISDLIKAAPYIVTVSEGADDGASIRFIRWFYMQYFRSRSIEKSFFYAQQMSRNLNSVLTRRALHDNKNEFLIPVIPTGNHIGDCYFVDMSEVRETIQNLGMPRDEFFAILARKIRVHNRIFDVPNQRVTLPIEKYFGVFSWENAADVIKCHKLLRIKPEIDENTCEVWANLMVSYNDSIILKYRLLSRDEIRTKKVFNVAFENFRDDYDYISKENIAAILKEYVFEQYKITKSLINANLDMAKKKIRDEDFQSAVVYLETVLSSIHDLIDALTKRISLSS